MGACMSGLTPQQAAQEFLRRTRARSSLLEYSQAIDIPGVPLLTPDDEADEGEDVTLAAKDETRIVVPGAGKLKNRLEKRAVAYDPVEARLAIHHAIMMRKIQEAIVKPRGRSIMLAPPGSAKSTYVSVVGSSWAMGRKKNTQVILGSYATGIAAKQSRKVRSIVRQPRWSALWPDRPTLAEDQRAIDDWSLTNGSSMMAAGMLAGITGNRCDLLLLDDPVANREQADSPTVRDKIYSEYIDTAMTRAKPWMSVILVMCMVGSTRVLLANGTEKPLKAVRRGDTIASYRDGVLVAAEVLNWTSQGIDEVFTVRTAAGATVTANARHPFLVERNGELQWVRLAQLLPNDCMVSVKREALGLESSAALTAVSAPQSVEGCACPITAKPTGPQGSSTPQKIQRADVLHEFVIDTESALKSTTRFSRSNAGCAPYADAGQERMSEPTGAGNSVSTTATIPAKYEDSYATTAISQSAMAVPRKSCSRLLDTYNVTLDRIASIEASGREEVFDIQVNTENFIANGLVSHNTRWHEDDLVGAILPENYEGESGMIHCRDGQYWDVLCIPAEAEREDDPLGRNIGEFLWPEWFPREHWTTWRDNPRAARTWAALFQQRPAPYGGIHFNRDMFQFYDPDRPRVDE
jgi:hypothetical protein